MVTANLTRVDLLRDGQVVDSSIGVAPGEAVVFEDEPDELGTHVYQAIPYNEYGKGLKSEKLAIYVGPDIPSAVQNLTATDGGDVVSLKWNKVGNVGENGGVVNPATVNYSVWSTTAEESWGGYYVEKKELLAQLTDADSKESSIRNTGLWRQRTRRMPKRKRMPKRLACWWALLINCHWWKASATLNCTTIGKPTAQ